MVIIRVLFFVLFFFSSTAWAQISYPPPSVRFNSGTPDTCFETNFLPPATGSVSGGQCSIDVDDITPADLANTDFGSFSCNGTTCSLDTDSVGAAQLDALSVESELEGVLDLPDLQGVLSLAKGGTNNPSLTNCAGGQVATVAGGKIDCTTVPQADIPVAQAFHVDPAGNDSTGTGSINQPVRTINKALDLIAATGQACALTCATDSSTSCSACFGGTNVYTCSSIGDCSAGATSCTSGRCIYPCNENSDCPGAGGLCKGSRCSSNSARTCSVDGDCPGGDTCSVSNNNSMCGGNACSSTPKRFGALLGPGTYAEQITVARTNLPGCVGIIGHGKLLDTIVSDTSGCVIDYSNTNQFSLAFATALNRGDGDAICTTGNGVNPTFDRIGAVHDGKGRDLRVAGRGNITTNVLDITTFGRGSRASGYSVSIELWGSSCSHDRTIQCLSDAFCNALSAGSVCDGLTSGDVDFRGGLVQSGQAAYCVGGSQDGTDCTASATACTNGGGVCDGGVAFLMEGKACGNWYNNLVIVPYIKAGSVGAGDSTVFKITEADCHASSPFPHQTRAIISNGVLQGLDGLGVPFAPDKSLVVGANATLWVNGHVGYDVGRRSISGSLLYGDTTNFSGGNGWLGWLPTSPPDPQNSECWYQNDISDWRCRRGGVTVPMTPWGFKTIDASAGTDPVADTDTDTLVVTGTAPIVVTGDSSADSLTITCNVASASQPGCLASADFTSLSNETRTHATDCTSLTDGKAGSICEDQDDGKLWVCLPSSGDCDTALEWKQIERIANRDAANGYAALDGSSKLHQSYMLEVMPLSGLSDVGVSSPATDQVLRYSGGAWGNASISVPIVKIRTSDSSAKNANASLTSDSTLASFSVASGSTYYIEANLIVTTGATADLATAIKGPASSTCKLMLSGRDDQPVSGSQITTDCDAAPTSAAAAGVAGTNQYRFTGYFTAGGAGTVDLQWAQNQSQGTDTILQAGSSMSVTLVP